MNEESAFILLFVVATGVALAVRVVRVPYTVALVLAGLAIGALQPHSSRRNCCSPYSCQD